MRHLPIAAVSIVLIAVAVSPAEARGGRFGGAVHVGGYTRSNGTHVQPHMRSAPDGTRANNWTVVGNANPYTGKPGVRPASGAPRADSDGGSPGAMPGGGEAVAVASAPVEWCPTRIVVGSGVGFCLMN